MPVSEYMVLGVAASRPERVAEQSIKGKMKGKMKGRMRKFTYCLHVLHTPMLTIVPCCVNFHTYLKVFL